MFYQPGAKLKTVAKVLFWIGLVASCLIGIAIFITSLEHSAIGGLIGGTLYAGILIAAIWISCLSTYALGHLIEVVESIKKNSDQVWADKAAQQEAE